MPPKKQKHALCKQQADALAQAYAGDLGYLIQGPPGTGKTLVLARLVVQGSMEDKGGVESVERASGGAAAERVGDEDAEEKLHGLQLEYSRWLKNQLQAVELSSSRTHLKKVCTKDMTPEEDWIVGGVTGLMDVDQVLRMCSRTGYLECVLFLGTSNVFSY
jgi:hypothetical protein